MFHIKIKKLREDHGLTQKEVADLLHVERTTYSYYESGKTSSSIPMIVKLSELYSVLCDYLIKDDIKCKNPINMENNEYNKK